MAVIDLSEYKTPPDVAEECGLQYATLMARIDRGKVKTIRWGRFHFIHLNEIKRIKEEQEE
jgi:hypothetical protein